MKEEEIYFNLGKSIHIFNEIELFINLIITHHIQPKDEEFFLNYILNTSTINFGSKIKILINLEIFDRTQIKKIRDYSSNRNVFAHSNKIYNYEVDAKKEPSVITIVRSNVILKTNSEGKISKINYHEFIKAHIQLQNKIIDFITDYVISKNINTHHNHIGNLQLKK